MSFVKFPSIESFSSVHHDLKKKGYIIDGENRLKAVFRGKIKLHGTNAGVYIAKTESGVVVLPAKRSGLIPEGQDNAGFAAWLRQPEVTSFFAGIHNSESPLEVPMTVFGEWAGPGVQKGDAVSLIDKKRFFVFSVSVEGKTYSDPSLILDLLTVGNLSQKPDDVRILPWGTDEYTVNFMSTDSISSFVEEANRLVAELETVDLYIRADFGVHGPGEGYVFYDIDHQDMALTFKAKTARHMTNGVSNVKSVSIDPIVAEGAANFAKEFVSRPRVDQAIYELFSGDISKATIRDTGAFLKWVNSDVHKESKAALEASGLTWESVQKAVSETAKFEFFKRLNAN